MRKVSGSLSSTFYLPQLSKTYVAYGAGIPIMQEQSQESLSILMNICTVLINFIVFIIMDKVTNRILPEREIGATFIRVLCNACTTPLMKIDVKACPV
jgi:hypothetical protein